MSNDCNAVTSFLAFVTSSAIAGAHTVTTGAILFPLNRFEGIDNTLFLEIRACNSQGFNFVKVKITS